jgi:hypothetical protein
MARFYGTIQGQRGKATRLGHTGLDVTAQSYEGDVCITLEKSRDDDGDLVHIYARPHDHGGKTVSLFCGKIADLLKFNVDALMHQRALDILADNAGVLPADRDAARALPRGNRAAKTERNDQ